MGRVAVRLKEVVYTLSPFQQNVLNGLWTDLPHTIQHHMQYIGGTVTPFFLVPLIGTYMYAENFNERKKLHHRY